jgi:hypothetical protein
MSVAFTEQAVRERRKTVTRRVGWRFLKPGDRLTLCRKVMGRKPGEPLVRLAEVEVVDVRRELLADITSEDVAREGFPDWGPLLFITFFCEHMRVVREAEVTRIEWRYRDQSLPGVPSNPRDLLTDEQRERLDRDLAETARIRRRAAAEPAGVVLP